MTNSMTHDATGGADAAKAEQGAMKPVGDEVEISQDDEAKQISAHAALTELKKKRNKQRKF